MSEKHTLTVPTDVLADVLILFKQAEALLRPYVTQLTPSERRGMAKMGEKTMSFVEKANKFAAQNPNLVPPYLDMTAFDMNFADANKLLTVFIISQQLYENLDDTAMVARGEAYQDALVFYNSAKMAASQDIPGAKVVYEELKKRFPSMHKRSNQTDSNDEAGD
jgi:hypothetical protein